MKALITIVALIIVARCTAETSTNLDFRFPVRVVNGQRVDLHYLFSHWRTGPDAVTNSRWVLLTGTVAQDNPGGWIGDGKTESASGFSSHQKVLVLNPPRGEREALDGLLAQQKELKKEDSVLQSEEKSLAHSTASKPRHHHTTRQQNGSISPSTVSNQESSVAGQLNQVDKELAAIPKSNSSTNRTTYHVDFFVFYTGQIQAGMPVMDFGVPTL